MQGQDPGLGIEFIVHRGALRAEIKKLKAESARLTSRKQKLAGEIGKDKTALDIAGKAFALLADTSSSADSNES